MCEEEDKLENILQKQAPPSYIDSYDYKINMNISNKITQLDIQDDEHKTSIISENYVQFNDIAGALSQKKLVIMELYIKPATPQATPPSSPPLSKQSLSFEVPVVSDSQDTHDDSQVKSPK